MIYQTSNQGEAAATGAGAWSAERASRGYAQKVSLSVVCDESDGFLFQLGLVSRRERVKEIN